MWFDSEADLLPGLLPGLYRGITFQVPDTTTVTGRRVAEYLFPGVDAAAYDDFGLFPGEVTVNGLIIGDDYIAQGKALEAAFQTPGTATLVHPWLGPMTVLLMDPGEVSFAANELRVVRFSVTFKRMAAGMGFGLSFGGSSLTALTSALSASSSAASALNLAAGSKVISATRQKAAARSYRIVTTLVSGLVSPPGAGRFKPRLASSLPSLTADPIQFDAMIVAIAARIGAANQVPAVAPSAEAKTETPATSSALVTIGQALVDGILAELADAPSDVDASLLIAAASQILAAASNQAIYLDYDSRTAAIAYRSQVIARIGRTIDALDVLSSGLLAAEGSGLRRALRTLESAIVVDINETLGRLPTVQVFEPGKSIDSFLLAAHVSGDWPERIEAVYRDIIARNRPRHPAQLDMARIEVKI